MKKRLLFITSTIVGLILLAAQAGNSNSATAMTFSSSQTAAEAIKNDDVQIEVLHARICRDTHHQEEGCCIQEVFGRIVSVGKNVDALRSGDLVGFSGKIIPCGRCHDCKSGHVEQCRNAGWVCDETCRLHANRCRNRIVTRESNVIRISGNESKAEAFSLLCKDAGHHPSLRCYIVTDDYVDSHCHGRRRHCCQ